jgi:hypothetical protein
MTSKDKSFDELVSAVVPKAHSASPGQVYTQAATALVSPQGGDESTGVTQWAPSAAGNDSLSDAISQNTTQLGELVASLQAQLDAITDNTRAVTDNTSAKSSGSTAGSVAKGVLGEIFGGALATNPILSGLVSLFGASSSSAPQPLTQFSLPPALNLQGAVSETQGISAVSYGQDGLPRASSSSGTAQAPQQITVNIQAMDSQSFMDHSEDIAAAVKNAMLHSNSLNDVIAEL